MRMKFPKIKMTITKSEGYCYHNYNVGDEFILEDFTHPPKHFCAGIYQTAFPAAYGPLVTDTDEQGFGEHSCWLS